MKRNNSNIQKVGKAKPAQKVTGGRNVPLEALGALTTQHQNNKQGSAREKQGKGHQIDIKSLPAVIGAGFTQALAREIVKNLANIGSITTRPFRRNKNGNDKKPVLGDNPILVDTSVLIDGRLLSIVNSGFLVGTLIIPTFVLGEIQHIADSEDSLRRMKGRRGLDVVGKLKGQKANSLVKTKVLDADVPEVKEVDHKLVSLAKKWKTKLITVDFNLAQLSRAQGIKILNITDLGQALKIAIVPGEELTIKITHEGKEREQGVGYLADGTMIVVDNAKDKVGSDVVIVVTKVHQTAAGQLFFARLK